MECWTANDPYQQRGDVSPLSPSVRDTAGLKDDGRVLTVPVIFHIAYEEDAVVIEASVNYSLQKLNEDFGRTNANFGYGQSRYIDTQYANVYKEYVGRSANTQIRFTHGQTVYSPQPDFTFSGLNELNKIKELSPPILPFESLNVWVVDPKDTPFAGFAQFPWVLSHRSEYDGVVISRHAMPSKEHVINTLSHEAAHWCGLYHIFQQSFPNQPGHIDNPELQDNTGDLISDTPVQMSPSFGDPSQNADWPITQTPIGESPHMWMNFMDYTTHVARFMFTADQSLKMRLGIQLWRPKIWEQGAPPIGGSESSESTPTPVPTPTPTPSEPTPTPSEPTPTPSEPTPTPTPPPEQDRIVDGFPDARWSRDEWREEKRKDVRFVGTDENTLLQTRKKGRAWNKIDLDKNQKHMLYFDCIPANPDTYVWVKTKKKKRKVRLSGPQNQYTSFSVKLGKTNRAKIWFGCKSKGENKELLSLFRRPYIVPIVKADTSN